MSTEERIDADAKDIRCLLLCIAMLERVDGVSIFRSPREYMLTKSQVF
jgi:hypothetical protein